VPVKPRSLVCSSITFFSSSCSSSPNSLLNYCPFSISSFDLLDFREKFSELELSLSNNIFSIDLDFSLAKSLRRLFSSCFWESNSMSIYGLKVIVVRTIFSDSLPHLFWWRHQWLCTSYYRKALQSVKMPESVSLFPERSVSSIFRLGYFSELKSSPKY